MDDRTNQIETIRYRQGVSQRELADRAGINVSTLSQIENGRVKPRAPTAFAIAQALGVPVDDLFMPSVSGGAPEESRLADHATGGAAPSGGTGTSASSTGDSPLAAFLEPRSPGEATADELAPAKESDGDLLEAR